MSFELEITGRVRDLVRYHFGDASRISNTLLKSYLYNSDDTLTKIKIEAGGYEKHENPSMLPSIYLYPEDITTVNMNPLYDYTVTVDGTNAVSDNYVDLESGAIVIMCEGATQGQSSNLAYELFDYIKKVAPVLVVDFDLFHINVKNFSSKQPINQKVRTSYLSTVMIPWARFNSWTVAT